MIECLRCGKEVEWLESHVGWYRCNCGFKWKGCKARGGEDLMYRLDSSGRENWWEYFRWFWVPCGCLGVFGEEDI